MDGLGPGVDLGHPAAGPRIAAAGRPPDRAGLAIQILATEAQGPGDGRVGATAPIVEIPTIGRLVAELPEVGTPPPPRLVTVQLLEGVGLAHQLAERLASLTVIFEDCSPPCCPRPDFADLTRHIRQAQRQGTGEPPVAGDDLPGVRFGHDHQRDQDSGAADALDEVIDLGGWVAVNFETIGIWLEEPGRDRGDRRGFRRGDGHGRGILPERSILKLRRGAADGIGRSGYRRVPRLSRTIPAGGLPLTFRLG